MKTDEKNTDPLPSPNVDELRFPTSCEVAERLAMSLDTIRRWVKLGDLPAYRIGGRLRFRWREIESRTAERFRTNQP